MATSRLIWFFLIILLVTTDTSADGIGKICTENVDCTVRYSICKEGTCQCEKYYFESNGKCLAGLDANCVLDIHCELNNTYCLDRTCQCREKFVVSTDDKCIHVSSYQQKCEYNEQCAAVIPNTHCYFETDSKKRALYDSEEKTNGTCQCLDDYHYNNGLCFKTKGLGEICLKESECFTESSENAVCRNGICACQFGYHQKDKQCWQGNSAPLTSHIQPFFILLATIFFAWKALR